MSLNIFSSLVAREKNISKIKSTSFAPERLIDSITFSGVLGPHILATVRHWYPCHKGVNIRLPYLLPHSNRIKHPTHPFQHLLNHGSFLLSICPFPSEGKGTEYCEPEG